MAALVVLAGTPAGADAQGVDQTCELSMTKFDPAVVNVAYPDQAATYYSGTYQAVPGTRIRIDGVYPHARYMSFNVYDNAQRPLDALADVEVRPGGGSTNPFVAGADRTVKKRSYTAYIEFGPLPSKRAPNTLYTGTGQGGTPNFDGTFIYRVYVPDKGLDELGGVGVPTVTLESTTSGDKPPASACTGFSRPSVAGVNETIAAQNGLPVATPAPGRSPPVWRKFINLPRSFAESILDNDYTDPARLAYEGSPAYDLGGSGGFLSNIHNAYLYTPVSKGNGLVLVTRLRAPTFPNTRPAPARMPGGQLRYFSMCQNDSQSQRFIACATDDQTKINGDGFMNYVVSTPGERPVNARAACGMTWIPWGPQTGGSLILRNMLPNPSFAQAIQRVPAQGKEKQVMGAYFPVSRYYVDKAAFEKLGCAEAKASNPVAATSCRDRTPPRSSIAKRRKRARGRRLRLSGRSIDFGCRGGLEASSRAGRIKAVQVSLARVVGRHCRFVSRRGAPTSPRSCAQPLWLRTRLGPSRRLGKTAWSARIAGSLTPGSYVARVRGRDGAGNVERRKRRSNVARFLVR
ncbi:MAG: hypothetical protein QOD53_1835 [Thermoleophilaceae bacterium]|nr:hypothetical protein [Thermoleophilaceae bacterium]